MTEEELVWHRELQLLRSAKKLRRRPYCERASYLEKRSKKLQEAQRAIRNSEEDGS